LLHTLIARSGSITVKSIEIAYLSFVD